MVNKTSKIKILLESLEPSFLEIIDESGKHSNHYIATGDSEYPTHIKIKVASKKFEGLSLLVRHKMINKLLDIAFNSGLHAAAIVEAKDN